MISPAAQFRADESGASLIEYSLLIGMITIAIITFISTISGNLSILWSTVASVAAVAAAAA